MPVPGPNDPTAADVRWLQRRLVKWFAMHGRHFRWRDPTASAYELVLAEVLLQRTTAQAVENAMTDIVDRFGSWQELAAAPLLEIEQSLKPLGLWQRRAATLKRLAAYAANSDGHFPRDRRELEALPGVGQYIANAILLVVHGQPEPLLDVNMARVLERVFGARLWADIRYDTYLQGLAHAAVQSKHAKTLNWAFLDLGALVCRPKNPRCDRCPLQERCNTGSVLTTC